MNSVHDMPPCIEEQYISATTSSNLRVQAEKRSSADILIASGMSGNGLGGALMRLKTEFDSAAKPRKPDQQDIERLSATIGDTIETVNGKQKVVRGTVLVVGKKVDRDCWAKLEVEAWYAAELENVFYQLKTFHQVREAITAQAAHWRIERPDRTALAIVAHWLDDTCRKCQRRGKERINDTPALSNKPCKHCHGTGHTVLPYGSAGRKIEGYIQDCVNRWRQQTTKKLHGFRNSA